MNTPDPHIPEPEPITLGFTISTRISSLRGSPVLSLSQPFVLSQIFSSTGLLIGAEIILLFLKYIWKRETVPTMDPVSNRIIQMPLGELQGFLQRINAAQNRITPPNRTGALPANVDGTPSQQGPIFPTPQPSEAPLLVSLFITANYSNEEYTPSNWLYIPLLSFPGLRGAIPLFILDLLVTILVRCVVPPETTGAKPFPKPRQEARPPLTLDPEELIHLLQRFGRYFEKE